MRRQPREIFTEEVEIRLRYAVSGESAGALPPDLARGILQLLPSL